MMKTSGMTTVLCVLITILIAETACAHSYISDPQAVSIELCRVGGEAKYGPVYNCKGPCALDYLKPQPPYSNHYPGSGSPARTWGRGEKTTVKYTRNNHGPGGFMRLTIVPIKDAMDKDVHTRNAFHTSCWGANPVVATGDDLAPPDKHGFDLIGSDGQNHDFKKGYYTASVTIPDVVPDGDYYLGFLWYGGTSTTMTGNEPQKPHDFSYFGEYWSCAFIRIEGGAPLAASYTPKFVNDMSQFSEEGCMSAADAPGVAVAEPNFDMKAFFRKPARFANGDPAPITPANFGGEAPADQPAPQDPTTTPEAPKEPTPLPENPAPATPTPMPDYPTPTPGYGDTPKSPTPTPGYGDTPAEKVYFDKALMSCVCIAGSSSGCFSVLAAYTNGCKIGSRSTDQSGECVSSCCALCKETGDKFAACRDRRTQYICSNN